MNFYMKQKVFSFGDRFTIYDEVGRDAYYVEGEVFTFGKKLHLYDTEGRELASVSEKIFSFLPRYYVSIGGKHFAEIIKEFTFLRHSYSIALENGESWHASGDFWDHRYRVEAPSMLIADVSKDWFSWGDAYRISVSSEIDPVIALATVLVIDACIEAQNRS